MPFKDKFRRALTRSSPTTRSNSSASTLETIHTLQTTPTTPPLATNPDPTTPSITLTKTSSRLRLSKTLTWSRGDRSSRKEEKERKKREEGWEAEDRNFVYKPGKRVNAEMLRGWGWGDADAGGGREEKRGSVWSGVSPGCSRVGSVVDEGGNGRGSFAGGRGSLQGRGSRDGGSGGGSGSGAGVGLERVRSLGVGDVIRE